MYISQGKIHDIQRQTSNEQAHHDKSQPVLQHRNWLPGSAGQPGYTNG